MNGGCMMDPFIERYSRHLALPDWGYDVQLALSEKKVLLIGAGGLAHPVASSLVGAGVGQLRIMDGDDVALSNLARQYFFSEESVGQPKSEVLASELYRRNSDVRIEQVHSYLQDEALLEHYAKDVDLVVLAVDQLAVRQMVNAWVVKEHRLLVDGAAVGYEGFAFAVSEGSPCYHCRFPNPPADHATCQFNGVFVPLVGVIGQFMAALSLQILRGVIPEKGLTYHVDLTENRIRTFYWPKDSNCQVCGDVAD